VEIAVNRTVRAGIPISREILAMANKRAVDEIVMSGRKRTGVTKVLIGSTASDVIQAADRPVVMTG
jgi:nucleotide-binding universal stress UspA family protein